MAGKRANLPGARARRALATLLPRGPGWVVSKNTKECTHSPNKIEHSIGTDAAMETPRISTARHRSSGSPACQNASNLSAERASEQLVQDLPSVVVSRFDFCGASGKIKRRSRRTLSLTAPPPPKKNIYMYIYSINMKALDEKSGGPFLKSRPFLGKTKWFDENSEIAKCCPVKSWNEDLGNDLEMA